MLTSGSISFYPTPPNYPFNQLQNELKAQEFKNPIQEGQHDAIKESVKEDEKSKLKLDELLKRSQNVLLKISTVFPFTLFPTDVVVDAAKVDIIWRGFFWSAQLHSVMIKDISDVLVETSIFFAKLKIVDIGFTENSIDIPYFWRDDAMRAREIIQGLVLAAKEGVDLSIIEQSELADKLGEIGKIKNSS